MAFTLENVVETTSGPLARLDPAVNSGTLMLVDFKNPLCSPLAGVSSPTAVPNATAFANLADSALPGGVAGAGAGSNLTANVGGSISTNGLTFAGQQISFGAAGAYNLAASNPDFMVSVWVKLAADAASGQGNTLVFGLGSAATNLFYIDTGTNNVTVRGSASATSGVPTNGIFGAATGAVVHLAITRVGAVETLWLNGVAVVTATANATLPDMGAQTLTMFNNRSKLTIYRASLENLTISSAEAMADGLPWGAAQAVAAEYAAGVTRGFA